MKSSCNRIVVSTSRCGRDNPGSDPGYSRFFDTLVSQTPPYHSAPLNVNSQSCNIYLIQDQSYMRMLSKICPYGNHKRPKTENQKDHVDLDLHKSA